MSLKETLEQNQEPQQNEVQQADNQTNSDVQSNNLTQTPENQIQRFETAAALAEQNKEKTFSLDNQSYDTKYVQDFIRTGRNVDAKMLQTDFLLDTLQQSSKTGETGKCYGKSFENGSDCFNVMRQISAQRQVYGAMIDTSNVLLDSKNLNPLDEHAVETIKNISKELKEVSQTTVQHNGKSYDILLDMPKEKQWQYFHVLNEEISSNSDLTTKSILRSTAQQDSLKPLSTKDPLYRNPSKSIVENITPNKNMTTEQLETLSRLHTLMDACGNPEIRPFDASNAIIQEIVKVNNGLWKMPRSHFLPGITQDSLYLSDINHLPAELAHAFRNKNNTFGEASQFIRDGLKDILTFNSLGFTKSAQRKNYSDKDKMEYDTHKIVEPALKGYLDGEIPTIEQMYAQVDAVRKKEGISYSQTDNAEEMTQKGYEQQKQKTLQNQTLIAAAKTR